MPAIPPSPISPVNNASLTNANPNIEGLTTSGSDASGTQDWWVHIQTVDIMYLRNNKYDSTTSSTVAAPNALFNYLDVHYQVQTVDEVWENATFSGEAYQPQTLELVTNSASAGGFGVCGVVNTVVAGMIRRPARKDAAGVILDTTGVCTQEGNFALDNMPGAYDIGFDTSGQVNSNLQIGMGKLTSLCPSFKSTLVDL